MFAGGNADVDIEMLESATLALLINHDDAAIAASVVLGALLPPSGIAQARALASRSRRKSLESPVHRKGAPFHSALDRPFRGPRFGRR